MNDDRDPIIDACLEEVLGGCRPPDVVDSVLREWSRHKEAATADELIPSVPLLPPVFEPPPFTVAINRKTEQAPASHRSGNRPLRRVVVWLAGTVALVIVVTFSAILIDFGATQDTSQTVQQTVPPTSATEQRDLTSPAAQKVLPPQRDPQIAQQPAPIPSRNSQQPMASPSVVTTPRNVEIAPPSVSEQNELSIDRLLAANPTPSPLPDNSIVTEIDSSMRAFWSRNSLSPMAPITDAAWYQRVFQVVLGRDPTAAESAKLRAKLNARQREELVVGLLNSDAHREEFARRWSELLTRVFLSDDLLEENSFANREGMLQYFRRALLDGRAFDRMTEELLTATGTGVPGTAEYNGAANFLLARSGGKFEQATSDTSRLLLGRNVECLQCHDDRDQRRQQSEFWELNSFFRQLAVIREDATKSAQLRDVDFLGEDRQDGRSAVVFFERPDGVLKTAFPAFPGKPELPKTGLVAEANRRQWLARCITTSPEFRQAITNRLWGAVYGTGLVPLDNLAAADSSSATLLNYMADQFAAHQYNPRQVILWAVLSEPFTMPSHDRTASLTMGESMLFQRFVDRRPGAHRPVQQSLLAVVKSFGQAAANAGTTAKVEGVPLTTTKKGKIVLDQAAEKPLYDVTTISADPLVKRLLANPKLSTNQKAQHLFQLVLHRQPRRRELDVVEKLLEKAGNQSDAAWDSIWSALHSSVP